MGLKISANTAFTHRYLLVDSSGVVFCETSTFGGVRRFNFDQVDCILSGEPNLLSFQVGDEVFSLPYKPRNSNHKKAIETLIHEVRRANKRQE